MKWQALSLAVWLGMIGAWLHSEAASAQPLHSYALVGDDGTLTIRGRKIRLFGIYIPPTPTSCRVFTNPSKCASRATLALDFRIQGFVYCLPVKEYRDRSVTAQCFVDRTHTNYGLDLSMYLLSRGWAVALPGAPFSYQVQERLARTHQLGVWGYQADVIRR